MSPEDYRQAYQHNQDILIEQTRAYTEKTLLAIGVSRTGTRYLGAAAGLAVNQDIKLNLNKQQSLAVELTDIGEDDRAIVFGISLDW